MNANRSDIQTTWTEQQVRDLVENQREPFYQEIQLPYGLKTKGSNRAVSSARMYPKDLTGKTVLDVGCQIGHFSIEAVRRGAKRVLGIDINPYALEEAKKIADCLGFSDRIEHRWFDIERQDLPEKFDFVICPNVMHHFKNPLLVLDRMLDCTREQLLLELPSFGPRDCKRLNVWKWIGKILDHLPVMYAGECGVNGPHQRYSPKYGIAPKALRNVMTIHRNTVARVDTCPSDFKYRYFAFAHKRRFDRFILLGGPPSSGKSTLMEALIANEQREIGEKLNVGDGSKWRGVNSNAFGEITEPHLEKVMMHFSFIHPYVRHCFTYERDEQLDVLDLADELQILTLWTDPKVNLERFDQKKIIPRTVNGKYTGSARYLDRRTYLEDPKKLMGYYDKWFEYVQKRGFDPMIVDNTNGVEFINHAEWLRRAAPFR